MDFGFGGRDPRTNFKYPKERALQIPLAKTVSFGYFRSADSSSVTSCGGVSYGHPADRMAETYNNTANPDKIRVCGAYA